MLDAFSGLEAYVSLNPSTDFEDDGGTPGWRRRQSEEKQRKRATAIRKRQLQDLKIQNGIGSMVSFVANAYVALLLVAAGFCGIVLLVVAYALVVG
jgi:hypothetical protein